MILNSKNFKKIALFVFALIIIFSFSIILSKQVKALCECPGNEFPECDNTNDCGGYDCLCGTCTCDYPLPDLGEACDWGGWSGLSSCSVSCGGGSQDQTRVCGPPGCTGGSCSDGDVDTNTVDGCNPQSCCSANQGDACNRNVCGGSGTINCDGSCSASEPSVPGNLGDDCNFNACGTPGGVINCGGSCSGSAPAVPTEVCDGSDNDCDGSIDEGVKTTYYRDADVDTYGSSSVTTQACSVPAGYVTNSLDCNDGNAAVKPGAAETCNGVDDDCDGSTDEGVTITYYRDQDLDTYTNNAITTQACSVPAGYRAVSTTNDCNDANAAIYPNAAEVCNGLDDDCDGQTDENLLLTRYRDADGDLYTNNSWVISTCSEAAGYLVQTANDCNDAQNTAYPGHAEICTDGFDNECDATNYCDYDSANCPRGDNDCTVSVTGIGVSNSNVCSAASVVVTCNSSVSNFGGQYDVNSIVATLNGGACSSTGWANNGATFRCVSSGSGVQEAKCSIDSSKSYQSGVDQKVNVTVINSEVGLCFDGLDNDCDLKFDGNQFANSDLDCCAQAGSVQATNRVETSCVDGLDNDCDGSIDCGDSDCGDADDDSAFCAACTGSANTWQFGNDTLPFGGYTTYNTKECCGDDLNEDLSSGTNGCCNGPNECIDAIGLCRSGIEDTQSACSNGVDDDCDGRIDLMDLGCYGSVQGTVYDALGGGRILVNANVSVSPPGIGGSFSASDLTDSNGDFSIVKAIIGTYNIISRKSGYVDEVITITVNAGQVTTVDFTQSEGLNCHSDCTDNKGLCNAACDGFTDSLGASCSFANPSCNGRAVGSVFRYNTSGTQFETTCCSGPTTNYGVVSGVKPSCPSGLSQVVQSTPVLLNGIRVIQKTVICRRTQ